MGYAGPICVLWTILVVISGDVNGAAIDSHSNEILKNFVESDEITLKFEEQPATRKCGYEVFFLSLNLTIMDKKRSLRWNVIVSKLLHKQTNRKKTPDYCPIASTILSSNSLKNYHLVRRAIFNDIFCKNRAWTAIRCVADVKSLISSSYS